MKEAPELELKWPRRVATAAEAVRFIDAAGFCLLFPVKKVALPSLYYAMTRRTPVSWDGDCVKLWKWKDDLPRRRRAFYSKYFHGRGTFISLKLLPQFISSEGLGFEAGGHRRLYAAGRMSADACTVWEALDRHGPLATLELRHACRMDTAAGNKRYKRAILELSRALIVVHSGAEQETDAWASSRFDLTARAFSEETAQARCVAPAAARETIARKYLAWRPNAKPGALARLFRWSRVDAVAAMN